MTGNMCCMMRLYIHTHQYSRPSSNAVAQVTEYQQAREQPSITAVAAISFMRNKHN